MNSEASVTEWLHDLKAGHSLGAQKIWQRYVESLLRIARRILGEGNRRIADEEDVVIVVFDAAIQAIQEGRFVQLNDRHDLWQVLVLLTERKAIDVRRQGKAVKRGGGVTPHDTSSGGDVDVQFLRDNQPTPDFAVMMIELLQTLITRLDDDELSAIVADRLSGYTNQEIADRMGTSLRTVERRIKMIKRRWEELVE